RREYFIARPGCWAGCFLAWSRAVTAQHLPFNQLTDEAFRSLTSLRGKFTELFFGLWGEGNLNSHEFPQFESNLWRPAARARVVKDVTGCRRIAYLLSIPKEVVPGVTKGLY